MHGETMKYPVIISTPGTLRVTGSARQQIERMFCPSAF